MNRQSHTPGCIEVAYVAFFYGSLAKILVWIFTGGMGGVPGYLQMFVFVSLFFIFWQFSRIYHDLHRLDHNQNNEKHFIFHVRGWYGALGRIMRLTAAFVVIIAVEKEAEHSFQSERLEQVHQHLSIFPRCLTISFGALLAWYLTVYAWNNYALQNNEKQKQVTDTLNEYNVSFKFLQGSLGLISSLLLFRTLNHPAGAGIILSALCVGVVLFPCLFGPIIADGKRFAFKTLFTCVKATFAEMFFPIKTFYDLLDENIFHKETQGQTVIKKRLLSVTSMYLSFPFFITITLAGLFLYLVTGTANLSYDISTIFAGPSTNSVILIEIPATTNAAPSQRCLAAVLQGKLNDDHARLVVWDEFFDPFLANPDCDKNLSSLMNSSSNVILMQGLNTEGEPVPPQEIFVSVAHDLGVGKVEGEPGTVIRKHWPSRSPSSEIPGRKLVIKYPSLPMTAAKYVLTKQEDVTDERWLRYYKSDEANDLNNMGFPIATVAIATNAENGYFSNKVVFVGNSPLSSGGPSDSFQIPSLPWRSVEVGGGRILVTTYLNLINKDWLRKWQPLSECIVIVLVGVISGLLCYWSKSAPDNWWFITALIICIFALVTFVWWRYSKNEWFDWCPALCQLMFALLWALLHNQQTVSAPHIQKRV